MDNAGIVKQLKSLCQLDIDAIHAYMRAKEHIKQTDIKNTISDFEADHKRHVKDLSEMIKSYGDQPPEFSRDFKGYLLEGFAAMRSVTGTEGALKALRSGEKMTNKDYGEAVSLDFPATVLTLLRRNFDDEQRHLKYIDQSISTRAWGKAA